MIILFPIGYPIAKLLDLIVGHEEKHFSKNILVAFLKSQKHALSIEEIKMTTGAINLMKRRVKTIMIRDIFFIRETELVTDELIMKILGMGYSRIPIYNHKQECVKILITKSMMRFADHKNKPIIEGPFKFVDPIAVSDQNNAFQALERMKNFRTSILMVILKSPDLLVKPTLGLVGGVGGCNLRNGLRLLIRLKLAVKSKMWWDWSQSKIFLRISCRKSCLMKISI